MSIVRASFAIASSWAKPAGILFLPVALAIMVGVGYAQSDNPLVSAEKAVGSFCDRLRYVLVQGTSGARGRDRFRDIQGNRIEGDHYVGLVKLLGATRCEVHADYHKPKYWCYFSDGTAEESGRLLQEFRQLESQTDSCLVRTDWPGLDLGPRGRGDPGRRYDKGSVNVNSQVSYWDRHPSNQRVQITAMLSFGEHGYINVMTVEGR